MKIGFLNRRITISSFGANTLTATGGYNKGTETQTETWCHAKPLSGKELLLNGLQLGERAYEFTFRYEQGQNITQETELTYEGRTFRVISVLEIDEYKRAVKVQAQERVA